VKLEAIASVATVSAIDPVLWHQRLGHAGIQRLNTLLRSYAIDGANTPTLSENFVCDACIRGKMTRATYKRLEKRIQHDVLGLIHSDVVGPIQVPGLKGERYFVTFIDD